MIYFKLNWCVLNWRWLFFNWLELIQIEAKKVKSSSVSLLGLVIEQVFEVPLILIWGFAWLWNPFRLCTFQGDFDYFRSWIYVNLKKNLGQLTCLVFAYIKLVTITNVVTCRLTCLFFFYFQIMLSHLYTWASIADEAMSSECWMKRDIKQFWCNLLIFKIVSISKSLLYIFFLRKQQDGSHHQR